MLRVNIEERITIDDCIEKAELLLERCPSLNPSFLFPTNTLSLSASGNSSCGSLLIISSIHTSLLSHSQIIVLVNSPRVPVSIAYTLSLSITHISLIKPAFLWTIYNPVTSYHPIQYCSQRYTALTQCLTKYNHYQRFLSICIRFKGTDCFCCSPNSSFPCCILFYQMIFLETRMKQQILNCILLK